MRENFIETLKCLGFTKTDTALGTGLRVLFDCYEESAREWGSIIVRIDELARGKTPEMSFEDRPAVERHTVDDNFDIRLTTGSGILRCDCGDGAAVHLDTAVLVRCYTAHRQRSCACVDTLIFQVLSSLY